MASRATHRSDQRFAFLSECFVGLERSDAWNPGAITLLQVEQERCEIGDIAFVQFDRWHATIGTQLQRIAEEVRERGEAILFRQFRQRHRTMRVVLRRRHARRRLEVLAWLMAGHATYGVKHIAAALRVHILRALRLERGLRRHGAKVVQHGFSTRFVIKQMRHVRSRLHLRWISDESLQPSRMLPLRHTCQDGAAPRRQTGVAAVAIHTTEFIEQQPTRVCGRCLLMKSLEARDQGLGMRCQGQCG